MKTQSQETGSGALESASGSAHAEHEFKTVRRKPTVEELATHKAYRFLHAWEQYGEFSVLARDEDEAYAIVENIGADELPELSDAEARDDLDGVGQPVAGTTYYAR